MPIEPPAVPAPPDPPALEPAALLQQVQALQESEARFRRMADASPDCIWITDLVPERVVYASPSFERIWGHTVEDLYREPRLWVDGIHPDDRASVGASFGGWVQSGSAEPWSMEFRILRPDGSVRWIHDRGRRIAEGDQDRVSGIATDITERVLAEAALRESEQRFALAVAAANEGIWDLDLVTGSNFVSERAQALYGMEIGPTLRMRYEWRGMMQIHPDDVPLHERLLEGVLSGRDPVYEGEWRIRHPDGQYRWLRVRAMCVRDAEGRPTRLAGSVGDIDAHKRAEAALRQGQRLEAVGTLAGGIAHDFNNILGAILGFGEMAKRSTRAGSRARRDVDFILTAGERGRALVERLLAFSGSGLGARVPVHVEGVVQEGLSLLSAAPPTGVRIDAALQAGTAAVLGDPTQLHQVVMNLAHNALQAMPQGGVLRVALRVAPLDAPRAMTTATLPPGEYLVLEVADTGSGIAPAVLLRIFDPFFTTKEAGAGTGLGLSLVHGIVSELGGAVDVATEEGQGSRFTAWLPRAGDVAPAVPRDPASPPRGAHEQILLVDDEEALVRLMTDTLLELGYVPVGFTAPAEALAAFTAHPERFDALVTDERMPGMAGAALIEAVRRIRPGLPVLLLSGYLGADVVQRAGRAGADAMLRKPVSRVALAEGLAGVLAGVLPPVGSS